jgi:hypothetical protein
MNVETRVFATGLPVSQLYIRTKFIAAARPIFTPASILEHYLTGKRFGQVQPQRTKREYALFLKELAARYPEAVKIRLVQDNLSTHRRSAFCEILAAGEAFALAQRFEFYYTPKSASWLNMIECKVSALARQCLDRRIPKIEQLEKEVLALIKERSEKKIKINWQFSIEVARDKLNKHYQRVFVDNLKYKKI